MIYRITYKREIQQLKRKLASAEAELAVLRAQVLALGTRELQVSAFGKELPYRIEKGELVYEHAKD